MRTELWLAVAGVVALGWFAVALSFIHPPTTTDERNEER